MDGDFHTALSIIEDQYIRARVTNKALALLLRDIIDAVEQDKLDEYKKYKLGELKSELERLILEEDAESQRGN